MDDRTTKWAFTAYECSYNLLESIPPLIAEWGWQDEICPKTNRKHRQGYIRTKTQQRHSALRKILPGVHIEAAKNWDALMEYCGKEDTRDPSGTQVKELNNYFNKYTYMANIQQRFVDLRMMKDVEDKYDQSVNRMTFGEYVVHWVDTMVRSYQSLY